ncbi:hypothetical protein ES332_D11G277900v1 [Gossypium tomentosum]|uniref:Uncharacterized protein n=1 Tax=Gossypium tomentosum TaxID=34277 RepID=A0A5D2ISK8_GOSTO|nr:hypothetical protein ES332_D11G277900v1 [Gossypium tomentosum]
MPKCTKNKLRLCLRISLKAIMKLQGCLSRLVLMYSSILFLAELESFKMEYANARLECNAADECANILASEVIWFGREAFGVSYFIPLNIFLYKAVDTGARRLRSNELKLERQLENSQAEISSFNLYHWCIHQLVLIVRYYMIAMNNLQCIALEDTLLLAWETNSKPVCRPASKLNQISSSILFILFICNLI